MRISDWSSDVCSSDLAARYGLTQADVQQLIATVVGGQPVAQTIEGRERYPVVVRYPRAQRDSIAELARLPLVAPNGVQLTLGQVVELSSTTGPPMLKRENGQLHTSVHVYVAAYAHGDVGQ